MQAWKDTLTPEASCVDIWLDGQQIVTSRGRLGYLVPLMDDAKACLYH